jgi:hypothetical protein
VLVINDTTASVEVQCPACGAKQTLPRFVTRQDTGRERCEPDLGQWLPCRVCQEWSPIEPAVATATDAR